MASRRGNAVPAWLLVRFCCGGLALVKSPVNSRNGQNQDGDRSLRLGRATTHFEMNIIPSVALTY